MSCGRLVRQADSVGGRDFHNVEESIIGRHLSLSPPPQSVRSRPPCHSQMASFGSVDSLCQSFASFLNAVGQFVAY